jgi:3,5-dioxohexanoate:acetyl-CoA acetone transferase
VASVKRNVVITCAGTGAIHTPSMSPYLPVTPDEIIADALGAAEAGAAVPPLDARESRNGRPDRTIEAVGRINITTGGSPLMPVDERVKPAEFFIANQWANSPATKF